MPGSEWPNCSYHEIQKTRSDPTSRDTCHVYGFHDLRRSHATYNYGKIPDKVLQARMGHASFATTQEYVKYAEAHQREAYPVHLPDSLRKQREE